MNPAITVAWAYVQTFWANARTHTDNDRGAVTVEQVLWYSLTALGVIVVGGLIWAHLKTAAEKPLPTPTAP